MRVCACSKQGFDNGDQVGQGKGFGKGIMDSQSARLFAHLGCQVSTDQEKVRCGLVQSQTFDAFQPIHAWHHQVNNCQVRRCQRQTSNRMHTAMKTPRFVPMLEENLLPQCAERSVIIYEGDSRHICYTQLSARSCWADSFLCGFWGQTNE